MKKPWYFYVIIAILVFLGTISALAVPIFVFYHKAEQKNESKINEIFNSFSSIDTACGVYCSSQRNHISYNQKEIQFDYYSISQKDDIIPPIYRSCDDVIFCDYVYSTNEFVYFTYSFLYNKSISYLLFKTKWEKSNDITFVASLDDIPRSIGSIPNLYDYDKNGFSFYYYYNTKKTVLYHYSIAESVFDLIGEVEDPPYNKNRFSFKTGNVNNYDNIEMIYNGLHHKTTFSSSCADAYDAIVSNGFKCEGIHQLNNYSLCIFSYDTDFWKTATILAVFSYDWDTYIEQFQGLYVVRNNSAYSFRFVY